MCSGCAQECSLTARAKQQQQLRSKDKMENSHLDILMWKGLFPALFILAIADESLAVFLYNGFHYMMPIIKLKELLDHI
jgi:hypothetical protein